MAESPSSRIPVLHRADGSWTTVEHKLRQLDDMAEPGAYVRLLAGCCRDSVQAARNMQAQLEAARAEVNALRQQLRKSMDRIAQMEEEREMLRGAAQNAEAEARKAADAVHQMAQEQSRLRSQLERIPVELEDSLDKRNEELDRRVHESLDALAKQQNDALEARLETVLGDRLADLQKARETAEARQRLLDEVEPWSPMQQCTFQELPLLRSSRDAPVPLGAVWVPTAQGVWCERVMTSVANSSDKLAQGQRHYDIRSDITKNMKEECLQKGTADGCRLEDLVRTSGTKPQ
ncbi:hypothetical protein HPB50_001895 [Hyalomma asiaticum]|uniref:Uncharacterized protein n=1 Tax=Hyalomma asiaticum TaxID=266040 RepID=A0ACB7SRN0_HYAAI|nr:hypothetical protein HPB50_001895 [Hyalomma asiaticum]